jgi:uncharacterized membrane protein (Fun14 family)
MNDPAPEPYVVSSIAAAVTRPLWTSKSLRAAAALALVGALMWWRAPNPAASPASPPAGSSPRTSALAGPAKGQGDRGAAWQTRAPLLFRLPISYIVGFLAGWLCRKSLKWGILAAGTAVAVIAIAQHTGLVQLDWAGLQEQVTQSLGWFRATVSTVRHFLTGYLPSATAAVIGVFLGARHG